MADSENVIVIAKKLGIALRNREQKYARNWILDLSEEDAIIRSISYDLVVALGVES